MKCQIRKKFTGDKSNGKKSSWYWVDMKKSQLQKKSTGNWVDLNQMSNPKKSTGIEVNPKKSSGKQFSFFFQNDAMIFTRASSKIKVPGKKYILKVTWNKSYDQFKSFIFMSFNVDIIIIVKWIVFIVIYLLGNRFTFYFFRSKRTVFIQQ